MREHYPWNRRHRRSTEVTEALHHQLEACRQEGALEAMLVADEMGICMAYAGPREVCDEVAAELPMLAGQREGYEWTASVIDAPVLVHSVMVDAMRLFVCAVGGRAHNSIVQLVTSLRGVERILHTT